MKIRNIVFPFLFLLMIFIPLFFCDLKKDRVSTIDNKLLTNFPDFSYLKKDPRKFFGEFDDWFKDSTGFREPLIKLYISVKNKKWLNKVRYKEGIYVYLYGEEGHVYFAETNGWLISKFQGKPILSDTELIYFAERINEISAYLKSFNIPLLFMICPDKETIYPEFYPKSIIRGSEPFPVDIFTDFLKKNTNTVVFNINDALLSQKDNFLLYPKLDTISDTPSDAAHYNQIGAFFGYQELMRHINLFYPQMNMFKLDDIDIILDDKKANVKLKPENISAQKFDNTFFENISLKRPYERHINTAYKNINNDLPTLLFLRDSYTYSSYTEQYIPQHFGKSIFLHYHNIQNLKEYINTFKPDIVILEVCERGLRNFPNHLREIPKLN